MSDWQPQLLSDIPVEGALSTNWSTVLVSCPSNNNMSEASELSELLLSTVLSLSLLATELMLLEVFVRVRADGACGRPVCGVVAKLLRPGDANEILFKKSRYATGGVTGVLNPLSNLANALRGPPAEGRGSLNMEDRDVVERGVLPSERAEGSEVAERSSEEELIEP